LRGRGRGREGGSDSHRAIFVWIGEEVGVDIDSLGRVEKPRDVLSVTGQWVRVSIGQRRLIDVRGRQEIVNGGSCLEIGPHVVVDDVREEEIAFNRRS
jgi:hypothetical protein